MYTKDSLLDFLRNYAPNAPIAKCLDIANQISSNEAEVFYLQEMLAIIADKLLTINGVAIDPELFNTPALQKAFDKLCYCHAWVVCGPNKDGMKSLLDKYNKV